MSQGSRGDVAFLPNGCIIGSMMKLARLKIVRLRMALTQQQLAEKAGINRATIARLEGGRDQPFPTTVRKLVDALGVQPEDLMEPLPYSVEDRPNHRTDGQLPLDLEARNAVSNDRLVIRDRSEVSRVLQREPRLASLVSEAVSRLVSFFPDARLNLALLTDPNYGDGEQLFIGVATKLPEDQAFDALRRFDQQWWVHNVGRARGLLCIDLTE